MRTSVSSSGKNHISFSTFIYASWTHRLWQPKYVTHAKEAACFALLYVIRASQLIEFSLCDFTLCVIESNVQDGREWVTKARDSHLYNMICEVFCQSWTAAESLRVMIMAGRGVGEQVPPHPFKQLTGREWRFPLVFFYPVILSVSEMQVPDFVSQTVETGRTPVWSRIHLRMSLSLDLWMFSSCFFSLFEFVCECFWAPELQREKCGVMTEALSWSPERRGYYSAYLMMNDHCFSTFARCLDSQQLLVQFPT